jgi:hypothetical protein
MIETEQQPPRRERARWKRGQGTVRKRWIEERTDAKNATEARNTLNERLGQVARGETPAALSKVRLTELHADMVADYKNKGQDLETFAVRWKHF